MRPPGLRVPPSPFRKRKCMSHRNTCTNLHCSIIHGIQSMETNQMPVGQMNTQDVPYPFSAVVFGHVRRWSPPSARSNVSKHGNIMLRERSQTPQATYYTTPFRNCPLQANPQRQRVDPWLPGPEGRGKQGVTANGYGLSFRGDKKVL